MEEIIKGFGIIGENWSAIAAFTIALLTFLNAIMPNKVPAGFISKVVAVIECLSLGSKKAKRIKKK